MYKRYVPPTGARSWCSHRISNLVSISRKRSLSVYVSFAIEFRKRGARLLGLQKPQIYGCSPKYMDGAADILGLTRTVDFMREVHSAAPQHQENFTARTVDFVRVMIWISREFC